jgi:hypothetical protein
MVESGPVTPGRSITRMIVRQPTSPTPRQVSNVMAEKRRQRATGRGKLLRGAK